MSTTNGGPPASAPPTPAGEQPQAAVPQLNVLAQYIKDFSFENPTAPRSLTLNQQPTINIQINVAAKPMTDPDVEIELKLEGRAETPAGVLFRFDLLYAGVFRTQNIPKDQLQPLLLIECPRLLFPFAREIIASAVQNGGFPPLRIDPVDFVTLYRQRMAQQQPTTA